MNNCNSQNNSYCPFTKLKNFLCRKKTNIAVLNLNGIIGKLGRIEPGLNIDNVNPLLEKAFETKNIKAVAINVNSPGGSPVQSELIFKRIRELSTDKKIPVFTFAQDVAASGGYFILLAGDEIFAHDASIVGSIGVISASFGFEETIKKIGVKRRVYAEGKNKAVLDPFLPEDESSIVILKAVQKDIYESFKNLVKERRGEKLKASEEVLMNGAFWSGTKSAELGLIDEVNDMRNVMHKKFGDKIKFITIEPKKKGIIKELISGGVENFSADLAGNLVDKIEEKSVWKKFF